MAIALIISVVVAILFISLFIDERNSTAGYRNEIKEQKKTIERLYAERGGNSGSVVISRPRGTVDDQDQWELTPELVVDVLKYNGYVPSIEDGFVFFIIQGERYFIRTDRLPYFMLEKPYTINSENYDLELFRQAAVKVTDEIFIGKVSISDDGETLRFQADAYEPSYGHCRDSLQCYVNIIHQMQKRLHEVYEEMQKQRENQKQLEAIGFRTGENKTGENKIMS